MAHESPTAEILPVHVFPPKVSPVSAAVRSGTTICSAGASGSRDRPTTFHRIDVFDARPSGLEGGVIYVIYRYVYKCPRRDDSCECNLPSYYFFLLLTHDRERAIPTMTRSPCCTIVWKGKIDRLYRLRSLSIVLALQLTHSFARQI